MITKTKTHTESCKSSLNFRYVEKIDIEKVTLQKFMEETFYKTDFISKVN